MMRRILLMTEFDRPEVILFMRQDVNIPLMTICKRSMEVAGWK